jgi:hypothetical protein
MGQAIPSSARCERCGALMMKAAPDDRQDPRLRCPQCDELDPLMMTAATGWLQGELKPPK